VAKNDFLDAQNMPFLGVYNVMN